MGSLRNIMNVDDDHIDSRSIRRDRKPGSRSAMDRDPSMSMPRYSIPVDLSNVQFSTRDPRRTSQNTLHSTTSPHLSGFTDSRRRSNTSTDSMESSYSHTQNHGQTNSYSGAPMRPIMGGNGSAEPPIKLTPITGRVSRAKKGVPVHTCEICRPAKTFTRAEHLRRHQLSHQPPELACTIPGCEKVFHRKDLLERHQQRHEQDDKMSKDIDTSSRQAYGSPSEHYGNSPSAALQVSPSYGGASLNTSAATSVPMAAGHWPSVGKPTSHGSAMSSPHIRDAQRAYQLTTIKSEYIVDPVGGVQAATTNLVPGFEEPRSDAGLGMMNQLPDHCMSSAGTGSSTSMPWADNSGMPSSGSGSTYSTPPSDNSRCHPSRTPSAEWTGQIPAYPTSSSPIIAGTDYSLSFGYATTPPQAYSSIYGDAMGIQFTGYEESTNLYSPHPLLDANIRSLTPPQLIIGQSSDTLVASSAALPTDRMMYPRSFSREPVDALGLFNLTPINLSREIRSAIPAYIEVYWDKVHSMYPIIHKPTFESASDMAPEHLDILQCAMAATATQLLEHEEHRSNGHLLHAYAWEKSKMITNTNTQEWPLQIMQAVLLCEYYARFRGRNKKAYQPSPRFETLYQMVINTQTTYTPDLVACDESPRWKIWIDIESRRRLLSACFLLDVHAMAYLEQPRVQILGLDYTNPTTLPMPLTMNTLQLWDAQNCQEWCSLEQPVIPATVGNTILDNLSSTDIATIPAFDASLFLATHLLQLPQRNTAIKMDFLEDAASITMSHFKIMDLFPYSPIAMTYLALHYTPLHKLLSVSGDSWVFNKKVLQASAFMEDQRQLEKWRDSGNAAVATAFASRALSLFLGLHNYTNEDGSAASSPHLQSPQYKEISDFWGIYVCALICWAFGHIGMCRTDINRSSPNTAAQWISKVSGMEPGEIQAMPVDERQMASGAISLARASLERDCLGGRSILLADAVGVLKKLEEGDNYRRF